MNSTINRQMAATDWVMLVTLAVLWGSSFFFVAIAIKDLPPLTLVALRVGFAALTLHLILLARGRRMPRDGASWRRFLAMGIMNNLIPFSLFAWAQSHIAGGLAAILNAATPLMTVAVAHVLTTDEKATPNRALGVLIGFSGVLVMVGPEALKGLRTNLLAQLACLAAPLSYAFAGVYGRRFKALGVPPLVSAAGQVTASAAFLLPVALFLDQPWTLPAPGLNTVAAMAALSVVSTALAYLMFFRLLGSAGATNLSLVTFLVPVSAIFLGRVFLGEQLQSIHFAGMALIGAGLACIDGRVLKKLHGR